MEDLRPAYLAAAHAARPVLAHPNVVERWTSPSALAEWTVAGLSAHMARAVLIVEGYLNEEVGAEEVPVGAAEYFASTMLSNDIHDELNTGIRERAAADAEGGHAQLLTRYDHAMDRLRTRLAEEPADRLIRVFGGLVMTLDDYLATRIVELLVHTDDLCVSVELPTPTLPSAEIAIGVLVDVARHRHGDVGVLRALTRRERDPDEALRVF